MLTKINMPAGGQNADQLLVVSWLKQVGDSVKRGDVLLEVETDKAVLEVESFAQGILLARMVEEGSYGTVGEVIAYIGNAEDMKELEKSVPAGKSGAAETGDNDALEPPHTVEKSGTAETQSADTQNVESQDGLAASGGSETPAGGSMKATPAAKKSIRDLGLNLAEVQQSIGKEILRRADVVQFAAQPPTQAIAPSAATAGNVMASDLVPLTPMRRAIAERMQRSASTIPSFTAEIEVDMSACIRLRSELNRFAQGFKVSYHDIIAKCVALAVDDYPFVNASFTTDGIRVFRAVNIGLAVSLEQGLVVPVVNDARAKGIATLAKENARNIAQVRKGRFDSRLIENGTFTISNMGKYPISRFTAIINPPQSCILAIGNIQKRPVWDTGQWHEQPTASLTGTFDHRVVDGVYGAGFLTRLKELLEQPVLLL